MAGVTPADARADPVPSTRSPHVARWCAAGALAAMFAHNAWASWLKWGDMLVDAGKELDQPAAILEGRLLYRDLVGVYGPLPTYVNALLYAVFGVRADVLRGAGLATAAVTCVLLYRLARRFTGRAPSVAVAGAFLYVCAFAQLSLNGNYNFVLPYTYAASYGAAALAGSVLFLVRHAQRGRARDFVLSVALVVVTALCKVEVLFAAMVTHAVFTVAALVERRFAFRIHGVSYAAAAAVVALVWGVCWAQASSVTPHSFGALAVGPDASFALDVMGLGDVRASLAALGWSVLGVVALAAVTAPAVWMVERRLVGSATVPAAVVVLVAAALVRVGIAPHAEPTTVSLRMTPVALALAAVHLAVRWWRDAAGRRDVLPPLLVTVAGLACLPRLLLQTWAAHFGFYLLPLALVGLTVAWCALVPQRLGLGAAASRVVAAAGVGALAGLALQHFAVSQTIYALKTVPIVGPAGRTYGFARSAWLPYGEGDAFAQTVRLLARLPAGTRVLAVPQGVALVYFAGHRNPYAPFEWMGELGDEEQLALWQAAPPDVVVQVDYHRTEPSTPRFGVDYGQESARWLAERYRPIAVMPERFIVISARRDAGESVSRAAGP